MGAWWYAKRPTAPLSRLSRCRHRPSFVGSPTRASPICPADRTSTTGSKPSIPAPQRRVWRAERRSPPLSTNRDFSIFADHFLVTRDRVYAARYNHSSGLAEALALDAHSGQQQWYWHSPSHLLALLGLWGWRTPHVLAYALSELRWSLRRTSERTVGKSIWIRLRSLWDTFKWEMLHGQWRRPASLLSIVFSAALYPGDSPAGDQLFIGASMGLSALRGSDRRLLWHELLMMQITGIIPEPPGTA